MSANLPKHSSKKIADFCSMLYMPKPAPSSTTTTRSLSAVSAPEQQPPVLLLLSSPLRARLKMAAAIDAICG
jgi:hypothetical protein